MKQLLLGLAAAGVLAGAPLTAAPAVAASAVVEQAKDRCLIGEQADGYLGFVPGASISSALRREVRDINQQRKAAYARIARANGVSTEVTAALTAEKLINQASSGECVRDQSGRWVQV